MSCRIHKKGVNQILIVAEIIAALFISYLLISLGRDWASGEETNKRFLAKDLAFTINSVHASPFEKVNIFYQRETFGFASEFKKDGVNVFSLESGHNFGAIQGISSINNFDFTQSEIHPSESEIGEIINIKPIISKQGSLISVTQEEVENLGSLKIPCMESNTPLVDWDINLLFFFNAPTGIPKNIVDSLETDLNITRDFNDIDVSDFIFDINVSNSIPEENNFVIYYLYGSNDFMKMSQRYACLLHNKVLDDLPDFFTNVKIEALTDSNNNLLSKNKPSIIITAGNKNSFINPLPSRIGTVINDALKEFHEVIP